VATAGDEQHDRERAGLGDLGDELVRRLQLLGRDVQLVAGQRPSAAISPRILRMCFMASETSPVPPRPWSGSSPRPR
jgi:hypothetical protein